MAVEDNITVDEYADDNSVGKLHFYLSGVILFPICVAGVFCNFLVGTVLTRKSMRTSTNCFLLALAVYDSALLVCTTFIICLAALSQDYTRNIYPHILPYIYPVGLVSQTCTIWITVAFTVERYIAIRHPLKAASMCTAKRARLLCLLITALSLLYNSPRWFEYTWHCLPHNYTNATTYSQLQDCNLTSSELGRSQLYEWVYYTGLYLPVMCFIPVIVLAVLNAVLVQAVHKSRQERKFMGNNNTKEGKENNITIMLVSVVVVFIICQVPALIYNLGYGITREYIINNRYWMMLSIIRNFTVTVNSAVNFILYCVFGQKFRRVFSRMYCRRLINRKGLDKSLFYNDFSQNSRKRSLTSQRINNNMAINLQEKEEKRPAVHRQISTDISMCDVKESELLL